MHPKFFFKAARWLICLCDSPGGCQYVTRQHLSISGNKKSVDTVLQIFRKCEYILPPTVFGISNTIATNPTVDFYETLSPELRHRECSSTNWVEYKGTALKRKMFLIIGTRDLSPEFGDINQILICHDVLGEIPLFVCNRFITLGFDSHVLAYEAESTTEKICVMATDLVDPLPVYAHTMADGGKYVVLRYSISVELYICILTGSLTY